MKKLYSIGEVSRILNIPTKALRNYDQLNLLKPEHVDGDTKYRYYAYDQFFTIDVIRYLNKVLFVPLDDIRELMDEKKITKNFWNCWKPIKIPWIRKSLNWNIPNGLPKD